MQKIKLTKAQSELLMLIKKYRHYINLDWSMVCFWATKRRFKTDTAIALKDMGLIEWSERKLCYTLTETGRTLPLKQG